jgi:hypothetical protein
MKFSEIVREPDQVVLTEACAVVSTVDSEVHHV